MEKKIDFFKVKQKLEKQCCSIHNKSPVATVIKNGTNISLEYCCEEFRDILAAITKAELKSQTMAMVKSIFKK